MIIDEPYEQHYATGDTAALVGVSPATLRQWERDGLHTPRRDSLGNRYYVMSEVEKLRKIKLEREIRHGRTGRRSLVVASSTWTGKS